MDQNSDFEIKDMKIEMAEDRETLEINEEAKEGTGAGGGKSLWRSMIITGVGVVLLIIVFIMFFKGHEKAVRVDLNTIKLRFNMLEGRLAHLEKQVAQLPEFTPKLEQYESSLTQRLDELSQRLDQMQKQMASAPTEAKAPRVVHKARYHEVHPGETLYRIAKKYDTSVDAICRLNNINPNQIIKPGQKLLVFPEEPE